MCPEDIARFVLSDCQDPALKVQGDREPAEIFAESMKDPAFRTAWIRTLQVFVDEIDQRIAAKIY